MDGWVAGHRPARCAGASSRTDLVGNSFGGAIALALAIRHPRARAPPGADGQRRRALRDHARAGRRVGLRAIARGHAHAARPVCLRPHLVNDELARLRYEASIRPGFQESFAAMFPAPRQRWVDAMASARKTSGRMPHETLVIHGREDKVIPVHLPDPGAAGSRAQLHVFGRCGHWTQIEHTPPLCPLVGDFLALKPPLTKANRFPERPPWTTLIEQLGDELYDALVRPARP
jgi:2-hydroxymuconate-semialdehyde hydrolase